MALVFQENREIMQYHRDFRVARSRLVLTYCQRPLVKRFRLGIATFGLAEIRNVTKRARHILVHWPICLFANLQGASVERFSNGIAALVVVDDPKIVKSIANGEMISSQTLFTHRQTRQE